MFEIFKKERPITEVTLKYQEYINKEREEDKKWANEPSLMKSYLKNGVAVTIFYERRCRSVVVRVDNGIESYESKLDDRDIEQSSKAKDVMIEEMANYMIADIEIKG